MEEELKKARADIERAVKALNDATGRAADLGMKVEIKATPSNFVGRQSQYLVTYEAWAPIN